MSLGLQSSGFIVLSSFVGVEGCVFSTRILAGYVAHLPLHRALVKL